MSAAHEALEELHRRVLRTLKVVKKECVQYKLVNNVFKHVFLFYSISLLLQSKHSLLQVPLTSPEHLCHVHSDGCNSGFSILPEDMPLKEEK